MEDERDDRRADTVEDTGDRLEITKIDVKSTQTGNDDKVRKYESPTADPGAPETAAEITNIDSNLDSERSGHRLTDCGGLAHLFFSQPAALSDDLSFHLADQRDGAAKSQQAETEKVDKQFRKRMRFRCGINRHDSLRW
jgi:hypothetical protein